MLRASHLHGRPARRSVWRVGTALWIVTSLFTTVPLGPSVATPGDGPPAEKVEYITLAGTRSAYVDVFLDKGLTLAVPGFFERSDPKARWFKATTSESFIGWQIERLPEGEPVASAVWLRYFDEEKVKGAVRYVFVFVETEGKLAPGKYRFILLAPQGGPKGGAIQKVKIPTEDVSLHLKPRAHVETQVVADEIHVVPGVPLALKTHDLEIDEGAAVLMGASMTLETAAPGRGQVWNGTMCLFGPTADIVRGTCGSDLVGPVVAADGTRLWVGAHNYYPARDLTSSEYKAVWRMSGVAGEARRMRAFLLAYRTTKE